MMVYYQPGHANREAARLDAGGTVILAFGQHRGRPLDALPEYYLRWLVSAAAADFVPPELQRRAAELLEERYGQALAQGGPPDLRRPEAVRAWAVTAPPEDVAHLCAYLYDLADQIQTTAGGERS